jgi:hypothetical protein
MDESIMELKVLCLCPTFRLWYIDDDGPPLPVCWCGHPNTEHLDCKRSCTGILVISRPRRRPGANHG